MARRAGCADLPLHGGHIPGWLADRMTRLGAVMSEAIVHKRVAAAAGQSFLVSVLWRRDGHGLAFLRDHDERYRCPQARADAAPP